MTWNEEEYAKQLFDTLSRKSDVEKVITTFKNQSRDREGISLLKTDFLEPETTEKYEESREGTIARELVEPPMKNNYMWERISRNNNKK